MKALQRIVRTALLPVLLTGLCAAPALAGMSAGSPRTVWQLVGVFFSEDGQAVGLTQINEKSGSGPKTSRRDNARSL